MSLHITKMVPHEQERYKQFLKQMITHMPVSAHYKWLYQENPHGGAKTWLAIDQKSNQIIGSTSAFPRKVWMRDHVTLASVGGDTFVNPRYRRKGIAKQLHQFSKEEMIKEGIKFIYGFPNDANLGAFTKAGCYKPGNFRSMRFILGTSPIIKRLKLGNKLTCKLSKISDLFFVAYKKFKIKKICNNGSKLHQVLNFDERFEKLAEETILNFKICCIRDQMYLNWRYIKNPLKNHIILSYEENDELHGFAVVEFFDDTCILFDFFSKKNAEIERSIICALIKFAYQKKAVKIVLTINPAGPYTKSFLNCGFKFGSRSTENTLMILAGEKDEDYEYMHNFENWHLTYGDYDTESLAI